MTARKSASVDSIFSDSYQEYMLSLLQEKSNNKSTIKIKQANKAKLTRSTVVDPNRPSRFQLLSEKVTPPDSLQVLKRIRQPIKLRVNHFIKSMAEQETAGTNYTAHAVRYSSSDLESPSLSDEMNSIDGIGSSSSTRKRTPSEPSTSRTPGNNVDSNSKSSKRRPSRPSSRCKIQENEQIKRSKRNEEKSRKKLLESCDKGALLETLLADAEVDATKLLEGYKKKRELSNWDEKDIQEEVSKVFDINLTNDNENSKPEQKTPLKVVLMALSNCFEDEFVDTVVETFGDQLEAAKVLEVFKSEELKSAILQKFTAVELLDLLRRSEISNTSQEILELISSEKIINHIQSRNDLKTSESLLSILLGNLSEIVTEEVDQSLENNAVDKSNSDTALINGIVHLIKSKDSLKTSQCLLEVMLEYGPKVLSDELKKKIKSFLIKRFSGPELNQLSFDVINYHLAQNVIHFD